MLRERLSLPVPAVELAVAVAVGLLVAGGIESCFCGGATAGNISKPLVVTLRNLASDLRRYVRVAREPGREKYGLPLLCGRLEAPILQLCPGPCIIVKGA